MSSRSVDVPQFYDDELEQFGCAVVPGCTRMYQGNLNALLVTPCCLPPPLLAAVFCVIQGRAGGPSSTCQL